MKYVESIPLVLTSHWCLKKAWNKKYFTFYSTIHCWQLAPEVGKGTQAPPRRINTCVLCTFANNHLIFTTSPWEKNCGSFYKWEQQGTGAADSLAPMTAEPRSSQLAPFRCCWQTEPGHPRHTAPLPVYSPHSAVLTIWLPSSLMNQPHLFSWPDNQQNVVNAPFQWNGAIFEKLTQAYSS